jgi:cold shock CspA family protein
MSESLPFAGSLKLWNPRGYGIVERDGDHRDAFVHVSVLRQARLLGLSLGQRVAFDVTEDHVGRLRVSRIARER